MPITRMRLTSSAAKVWAPAPWRARKIALTENSIVAKIQNRLIAACLMAPSHCFDCVWKLSTAYREPEQTERRRRSDREKPSRQQRPQQRRRPGKLDCCGNEQTS